MCTLKNQSKLRILITCSDDTECDTLPKALRVVCSRDSCFSAVNRVDMEVFCKTSKNTNNKAEKH